MPDARSFFDAEEAVLRHIKMGDGTQAGSVSVLGFSYYPVLSTRGGVNGLAGEQGFTSGSFARRVGDSGEATITLPNSEGSDGQLHRARFDIITKGRAVSGGGAITTYAPGSYRPGDEWVEVWPARNGQRLGSQPKFVGTPTQARINATQIELTLVDRWGWALGDRETAVGYWLNAPRDVIEDMNGIWQLITGDDFVDSATYTFGTGLTTSANGRWSFLRCKQSTYSPGEVELAAAFSGTANRATIGATAGLSVAAQEFPRWWMEGTFDIRGMTTAGNNFFFYFGSWAAPKVQTAADVWIEVSTDTTLPLYYIDLWADGQNLRVTTAPLIDKTWFFRIEQVGRWVYYFVNGELLGVLRAGVVARTITAQAYLEHGVLGGSLIHVTMTHMAMARRRAQMGATKGDYILPPNLQPGGVLGKYFNLGQYSTNAFGTYATRAMNPLEEEVVERKDATLDFTVANPPVWQPPMFPTGSYFGAVWKGSINLDLAGFDWRLRFNNMPANDWARLYVGRTRAGEEIIDHWTATTITSAQLRTVLPQVSGWFPLLLEYAHDTTSGGFTLQYERSDAPGTWVTVPATMLSTQGIYDDVVRLESHHDIIQKVGDFAGLQVRCDPRSLESGEFPGQTIPRVRQGRDVDYALTESEATGAELSVAADDVADLVVADAVGLADPTSATQIVAQTLNLVEAGKHTQLRTWYTSIADVTDTAVAQQQLDNLVYLSASPWEQVAVTPDGKTIVADAFPLPVSPNRQLFGWEPGDAPVLNLPTIGVVDTRTRQVMQVEWPFSPNGFKRPSASWRAQSRDDAATIRRIYEAAVDPQRNYQGQLVTLVGDIGGAGGVNAYSTVALPPQARAVRATAVVMEMSAVPSASPFTLEVNDVNVQTLTLPGTYDLRGRVVRGAVGQPQMWAQLTGGGGTLYTLQLIVVVRI